MIEGGRIELFPIEPGCFCREAELAGDLGEPRQRDQIAIKQVPAPDPSDFGIGPVLNRQPEHAGQERRACDLGLPVGGAFFLFSHELPVGQVRGRLWSLMGPTTPTGSNRNVIRPKRLFYLSDVSPSA